MPDTSDRYVLDMAAETQPSCVRGYPGRLVAVRLRDELLDGEVFSSPREAQVVIESWRRHDNEVRPHASLGYRAPAPEVILPAFATARPRPASPVTPVVASRPVMH
jgi:putative transposase